ncbi:MAG: UDP-2,3-diacylglucosamine diphosphatase [Bacteroidia bacterium]|nr:UDP-2,3-diacylglucosamine diphosphatase [Bacteroidia bacterium]
MPSFPDTSLPALYPPDRPPGKSIFFASDLHAGAPSRRESMSREKRFILWLRHHAPEAAAFYLLGDIWDFWFEYYHAVPKGHVRLLAALAEITDAGIPVFFQTGNHDLWLTGYLTEEIGLQRLPDPLIAQWQGMTLFLSHGHKVGPVPWIDRLLYASMENRLLHILYRWIHPDIGLWLGRLASGRSRVAHMPMDDVDLGDREYVRRFVLAEQNKRPADWYILAHRHLALAEQIGRSRLVLLGDWIRRYTFLRFGVEGWGLFTFSEEGAITPLAQGDY